MDTEFFVNGYSVRSNGLRVTANGYRIFVNGFTVRFNGLALTVRLTPLTFLRKLSNG